MPFSFPSSPSVGQTTTQNDRLYQWNGYAWDLISNIVTHAASHGVSGSDPITINSSQISNFNSGVSGLLPTISNSGDNRVLTSTGSSVGVNAETNLTFDGSLFSAPSGNFTNSLTVNGTGVSLSDHTHTASNITDFNSSVSGILTSFSGTISAPSGSFSTNLQIGSNNLTNTNTLNIINSSNLYLWSNFR